MAYFLGRDVKVAITSEDASHGIDSSAAAASAPTGDCIEERPGAAASVHITAGETTDSNYNPFTDVTGVDITLGKVDEDIAYMGQRTALKAEIKRETTLVLTMKKKDQFWSDLFTSFRYGVIDNAETSSYSGSEGDAIDGLSQPTAKFGYRAHLALNDDGSGEEEVISIPNMTFSEYSTTLNADGVTEETIEFMSTVKPLIANDGSFNKTDTALADI